MKKMFFVVALALCLPLLSLITEPVDIHAPDYKKNNPKEVLSEVQKRFSEIKTAQNNVLKAFKNNANKNTKLQHIENYQKAMDYQQVNLDRLRSALK